MRFARPLVFQSSRLLGCRITVTFEFSCGQQIRLLSLCAANGMPATEQCSGRSSVERSTFGGGLRATAQRLSNDVNQQSSRA